MGNPEIVRLLLAAGADANVLLSSANEGITALHLAAEGGHVEVVQLLLKAGASISACTPRNKISYKCVLDLYTPPGGYTALHLAAAHARDEDVKILIEAGAEVGAVSIGDGPSVTAIELADNKKHFKTVRLLLEAGDDWGRLRYDENYYFQKWFEEVERVVLG